jgi:mannosyltransferase OCH1-like enzyme
MIPKIIHYCWLGGSPLPPLVEKCIQTWNQKLPTYEIKRWDETNSDLSHEIVRNALKEKRWAFAVDYLRLAILYEHGGIYLDTDMELVSSFKDDMLDKDVFLGYECDTYVSAGVIGAAPHSKFIKDCMVEMENSFKNGGFETIPKILTRVYITGIYPDVAVYPPAVFYPFNPYANGTEIKQLMYCDIKEETVAIHHWHKSWKLSLLSRLKKKLLMLARGVK